MTEWELHDMEFGNCNCSYACGCQFNALPTYGNSRSSTNGDVLSGLRRDLRQDPRSDLHRNHHRPRLEYPPGDVQGGRGVAVTIADTYAHWCELHFNQHGRIRQLEPAEASHWLSYRAQREP